MAFRTICAALLVSTLPVAGCGTVANLANPRPEEEGGITPFGGVKQDVACIQKAGNGDVGFWKHAEAEAGPHPQVLPLALAAADLPLSAVGDVVTWPFAAAYYWINAPVPVPPVTFPAGDPTLPPCTSPATLGPGWMTPDKDAGKDQPGTDKPGQPPLPYPRKVNPE